ncbi:MAG: low molecular weight phosphotyrosine protein phosphatase, partial [Chitinophagaceae bacterium]|nr:low molecular weight phosphotyrosine protein phosphatase [Anaerolineae bacterium]
MIKVLFVCMGNICRSPMAEAVFQDRVNKAGLNDHITSDSAGTGDWHVGETAHPKTLQILQKEGIPYRGRARQFTRNDLNEFDYILAMDTENLSVIRRAVSSQNKASITLFLHYANLAELTYKAEVPNPDYSGVYELVYDLVNKGST